MPSAEPSSSRRLRVVVVGCGAVTRASLLPALAGHELIDLVALVDVDRARACALAESYGVPRAHAELAEVASEEADAVVLATPPAHHVTGGLEAIGRGWHVFVEKPMAISSSEAEALVQAAATANVTLSVGLYRRLLPVSRLLRGLIERGTFGRPLDVDAEEGGEYSWQLATLSVLTRKHGGGGVLIDIGSHLIDQVSFVIPGDWRVVSHADNSCGGVETDCESRFEIASQWGTIPVRLELSRTRELRGAVRVRCEGATLELSRGDFCSLNVLLPHNQATDRLDNLPRTFTLRADWNGERTLVGYKAFRQEFDDWIRAIRSGRPPLLSGLSVVPVVATIERCYDARRPLEEPGRAAPAVGAWAPAQGAPSIRDGARPRVLVTGAGGFLGGRTVELLLASGRWDVRPMVRRPASAARLARWPLDIIVGDVTSGDDLSRAIAGCDAVVHCAVGTTWPPESAFKTTVDGTKAAAEAALRAGVRRFVHVSSMAVHGDRPPLVLDESQPFQPGTGFGYARAKCLAEEAVHQAATRGLGAICLRPARIYGPFSKTFTVRPLSALASGVLALAGDADTTSNMVYVDNVVDAILRALDGPTDLDGQAFLITEPDQLSWRQFYEYFAASIGATVAVRPYPSALAADPVGFTTRLMRGARDIAFSPEVRALAKKVLSTDPYGQWPRTFWDRSPKLQNRVLSLMGVDSASVYREPVPPRPTEVVFRIDPTDIVPDKARALLQYHGAVPRAEAMARTLEWARHARIMTP